MLGSVPWSFLSYIFSMARTALSKKTDSGEILAPEQRWTVISEETGRRVYLASEKGINRQEAEALAEQLRDVRVVPEGALDRWDKFQPDLLQDALAAAGE